MSGIDTESAVVDWVIDYPESVAVFEEFGIDYCCGGKSLEYACSQAKANPAVVGAKLRIIARNAVDSPLASSEGRTRPMTYWVDRTPPGWVSRHSALAADPIALAIEIRDLAQSVIEWLRLPKGERWDTFQVQSMSAALFNRYAAADSAPANQWRKSYVSLLRLPWRRGSEAIQVCLAEMQQLLVAPFAVFKAVRVPLSLEDFPSAEELAEADGSLLAQRAELCAVVARLAASLRDHARNMPRCCDSSNPDFDSQQGVIS